jgi:fatty-acyl-CoA synthase
MEADNYPGLQQDTIGAALGRTARKFRNKIALVFEDRQWSFENLDQAAGNVAAALLNSGCKPGDRVATYGHNSDGYILAWLGCARAGLVHVPINFGLFGDELGYIIRHADARVILTDAGKLEAVAALTDFPNVKMIGTFTGGSDFDILTIALARADHSVDADVNGNQLAQIQYTSGTTSAPKGAMMQHKAILSEYMSCIHALDYAADDRALAALPLYHTAQMQAFFMPQMLAGTCTYLINGPSALNVFQMVSQHKLNSFFAPPTVWINLLRHPEFDSFDLNSLQKIYYGASIMPGPILEELALRLPNAALYNVYGQSEIGPVATVLSPTEHRDRPASAGRPVLNVETRIVDTKMNDVALGEQGEIVHRSPQLLSGYWQQPDETEAAFEGGWFHSGDVGYQDGEGYIYISDRLRDVINTGGVLVAGREVEDALFAHPAVSEVAVIGLPDALWIEAITAVVVLKQDMVASEEELIAFVRGSIAKHKVPKSVTFVSDLPRNASGKILKRELRTKFSRSIEQARN